ncbi:hypothetical protein [Paraburkholderia tropica]|uniref:hypothetical protein n=1 Tax=Paraburkholderia tropica TaxID=92647 RepID=UPI001620D5ED|nr:hypothetical protein [Paraburkholderia tropica]MBB6320632.1 hypothetical protein [Paraburkholderia tropica]
MTSIAHNAPEMCMRIESCTRMFLFDLYCPLLLTIRCCIGARHGALLVRALLRHFHTSASRLPRYCHAIATLLPRYCHAIATLLTAIIANNVWDSPGVDAIDTGFTRIDSQTKTRVFSARAAT